MKKFEVRFASFIVRVGKNGKYTKMTFESAHEAKSYAGKLFHDEKVDSVVVFEKDGPTLLVLQKTSQGVLRQEA